MQTPQKSGWFTRLTAPVRKVPLWCRLILFVLAVLLLLVHTQPVEKWIWRKVLTMLPEGVTLTARRFDLHLFRLSVSLRDVRLEADGLTAELQRVSLNAGSGILLGRIDIDEILVANGVVKVSPPESQEPPPPAAPLQIPPIHLGHAAIDNVRLHIEDKQADLNLAVRDLLFGYQDQKLSLAFRTPPTTLAGRALPETHTTLALNTADFKSFENILVTFATDQSKLTASGRLDDGFVPHLKLDAQIAADLLPEFPDLVLSMGVEADQLSLQVSGTYPFEAEPLPIRLETRFDYTREPLAIPIQFTVSDLVSGEIQLRHDESGLTGEMTMRGAPAAIARLVPELKLDTATVAATFAMPGLDPAALRADLDLSLTGVPAAQANATWQDGKLTFVADAQPFPQAQVRFQGGYDGHLRATLDGSLAGLQDLARYVDLPPEVCSGPVSFSGRFFSDIESWRLDSLEIAASDAAFAPYFQDDLIIHVSGTDHNLKGFLYSAQLNRDAEAAFFVLDASEQVLKELDLFIDTRLPEVEGFAVHLRAEAAGAGPFADPDLEGWLDVAVEAAGGSPVASLAATFVLHQKKLALMALHAETRHGRLDGEAEIGFEPEWSWDLAMTLETGVNEALQPLFDMDLPTFALSFEGNQQNMRVIAKLPEQNYEIAGALFPIETDSGLSMEIQPMAERVTGESSDLRAAGVVLSDIDFSLVDRGLRARTHFRLEDGTSLQRTLAAYWPEGLALKDLEGAVTLVSGKDLSDLKVDVRTERVEGSWQGTDFSVADVDLTYADRLEISPFSANFAGMRIDVSQATTRMAAKATVPGAPAPSEPFDLSVNASVRLLDYQALAAFMALPEDLEITDLELKAALFSDFAFEDPRVSFSVGNLNAAYAGNTIRTRDLTGLYHKGLWLKSGILQAGDIPLNITEQPDGFRLRALLGAADVAAWMPGFSGDARIEADLLWRNTEATPEITGSVVQTGGRLVLTDPWLDMSNLNLALATNEGGDIFIRQGSASLNGGSIGIKGSILNRPSGPETSIDLEASGIQVDLIDYKAKVTALFEYRAGGEADPEHNLLDGTILISEGYLTPKIKIKQAIEEIVSAVPELYFPDPEMEKIKVQINILTQEPIIIEHDIGYLELETPTLVVRGNLAEPKPYSGPLNINEGSSLDLGNQEFVFKNSQIQFHPNRPDDPYLQISLVSTGYDDNNSLNLNGYLSELGEDVDSDNLTAILANYLVNSVSSLVSVETEAGKTLFDTSFTFVISKPLSREVLARYAIPLVDQKKNQRFELIFGPVRHNYLSAGQQDQTLDSNLQHSQRLGFPGGVRPPELKKVIFPKDTPRWVRRRFLLRRDDLYSPTQWRRASLDLRRSLKERGYLNPTISGDMQDLVLKVDIDYGPQIRLEVTGVDLGNKTKRDILRSLRSLDPYDLGAVERRVERQALALGYPSAAAFADLQDDTLHMDVLVGERLGAVHIDFDKANALLGGMYDKKKNQESLLTTYLVDKDTAIAELRARLAALGYLNPVLQDGYFRDSGHFVIPVDPGPRGVLAAIELDGQPLKSGLVGQPFQKGLIDKVGEELAKGYKNAVANVKPRRQGNDVLLQVTMLRREDITVDTLDISGTNRISEKRIDRFLGFEPGMKLSQLVQAHKRLVQAGPFQTARLRTSGSSSVLEVRERNRWDINYLVTWDEKDEFGYALELVDHMPFSGFNELALRAETNAGADSLFAQLKFNRIRGTPLGIIMGAEIREDKRDPTPFVEGDSVFSIITTNIPEKRRLDMEFGYELSLHQSVSLGFGAQENLINRRQEFFLDGELIDIEEEQIKTKQLPARLTWLYRRLDSPASPRRGILASVGYEDYLAVSDENLTGKRATTKLTTFLNFGPAMELSSSRKRLLWQQRFEAGFYRTNTESRPESVDDSPFFLLGGATTVRGFSHNFVGPLEAITGSEDQIFILPKGGSAMFFFSQEVTLDTGFYDLGVTPFIDGGWVWNDYNDFLKSELALSGGLGLSIDTPFGYFRLDYAKPIVDDPFRRITDGFSAEQADEALRQAFTEWTFRFGRNF